MTIPPYGPQDGAADPSWDCGTVWRYAGRNGQLRLCRFSIANGTRDGVEAGQQDPCRQQHSENTTGHCQGARHRVRFSHWNLLIQGLME